ncbi:MAG: hypothetical protein LH702_36010 [Phormidesmis sp. CAN_BIN44]|nr:hypothetical protein [Phormidesmis sp. CAN_BIN44]
MKSFKSFSSFSIVFTSSGLLFLGACSSGNQTANSGSSPASPVASAPANESKSASSEKHSEANKGGQVIESGAYHLEFVPEQEAEGTHLDFYLQKGDNHEAVSTAKVTAQVQSPDGTQKSLDMKYDPADKHYTVLMPGTTTGEYKVAILSDISGEKVNGRFNFTK